MSQLNDQCVGRGSVAPPATTLPPTTLAPTTLAPTTLAPTTLAPTTLAPTTLPPTTLPPTTPPPDPLTENLVAHWTMDSDWTDSAGSNDGTASGDAAIQSVTKKIGAGAGAFDGTGDYVTVANHSSLNPAQMTVALWLYSNGTQSGVAGPLDKSAGTQYTGYNFIRKTDGDHMVAEVGTGSAWVDSNTATLTHGQWDHYAFTADGTYLIIYKNGSAVGSPVACGNVSAGSGSVLRIGGIIGADYWNGYIDDVRVFNVAKSADDVATIAAYTG